MAVIIEGTRPAFRIAEHKSGSGEPRDAISTRVFRTSPQVFQCSESDYPALSAHHEQGEEGANRWTQRSPAGRPLSKPITEKTERAPHTCLRFVSEICRSRGGVRILYVESPIGRAHQLDPNRTRGPE